MGLLALVFGLLFLVLGVLIGAVLLRASVNLANRVLPSGGETVPVPAATDSPQETFGAAPADPNNPFASPMNAPGPAVRSQGQAIPEPAMGKACGIVVVNGLASGFVGFLIGLATQSSPELALVGSLLNIAVGFAIASAVYSAMLPTTFGRAALVYLFTLLIVVAITVVIMAVIFAFSAAMA